MNKTEAVHVNSLLAWILGEPVNGRVMTGEDARYLATELAKRVSAALGAGLTPAHVDNAFNENRPQVVPQPAYLLLLQPSDVRERFAADDTCGDCGDLPLRRRCAVCQLLIVTDEQLRWAAEKTIGQSCVLDDSVRALHEAIVERATGEVASAEVAG